MPTIYVTHPKTNYTPMVRYQRPYGGRNGWKRAHSRAERLARLYAGKGATVVYDLHTPNDREYWYVTQPDGGRVEIALSRAKRR